VQDAYVAYQGAYGALALAIKEADELSGPQQRANTFGIHKLSPEEQSRLRCYLAASGRASFCLRAGLGSLALMAKVPIARSDKAAQPPKLEGASMISSLWYLLTRKASYNHYGQGLMRKQPNV
jgi:hypothetical protein